MAFRDRDRPGACRFRYEDSFTWHPRIAAQSVWLSNRAEVVIRDENRRLNAAI
jgi:hypothetical protein